MFRPSASTLTQKRGTGTMRIFSQGSGSGIVLSRAWRLSSQSPPARRRRLWTPRELLTLSKSWSPHSLLMVVVVMVVKGGAVLVPCDAMLQQVEARRFSSEIMRQYHHSSLAVLTSRTCCTHTPSHHTCVGVLFTSARKKRTVVAQSLGDRDQLQRVF